MSETTNVSLSRALKLKNRVVHRVAQLDQIITTCNSALEGNHEYDIRAIFRERLVVAEQLVALKTALHAANQPIQKFIFELAECKALIGILNRVDTKHGTAVEGYSGVKTNYVAQFRKPDIDREIKRVEQEIDRLQDELDQFNHRTQIGVPTSLLTLPDPDKESAKA